MAEIRNFTNVKKENNDEDKAVHTDFRLRLFHNRMEGFYRIVLILVIFVALSAVVWSQYQRHIYTTYNMTNTVERTTVQEAIDIRLQDSVLTYSKDGAHCTDGKGEVKWNETYEIQDVLVSVNKNVVAIAGYNARDIYVSDTEKVLGTINTEMPIRNIAVSATGYVTAVLADANVTWINTYSPTGKKVYYSSTTMANSGYPGAIALSPNGELLVVAYVYVDAGEIKTNMAFYNFGTVGDNETDQIVGVYTLSDQIVPDIRFLDDETVAAIGDGQLRIYKGRQAPMEAAIHVINDQQIQAVFSGSGYLGLVFFSDESEHRYRMDVYDASTQLVGNYYFDVDYTDILFEKNCFVIYNDSQCVIKTYKNIEKFNGTFDKAVNVMIPTGRAYKYLLVNDNTIDTIQLK